MDSIVYNAYNQYLRHEQEKRSLEYIEQKGDAVGERGTLWASDLGKCHRASILRGQNLHQGINFSTSGLDYMNTGTYTEAETLKALKHVYNDRLTEQVVLRYKMWSGKADFGIDIGTDTPVLIEHKTTSEKQFGTDNSTELPKKEHVGQALTYRWLYQKLYQVTPKILIFYKTWGNFGEFEVDITDKNHVIIKSWINGVLDVKTLNYDVYAEIAKLTEYYESNELPPRLEKKYKGCEFMGKPSCAFYDYCWGENVR